MCNKKERLKERNKETKKDWKKERNKQRNKEIEKKINERWNKVDINKTTSFSDHKKFDIKIKVFVYSNFFILVVIIRSFRSNPIYSHTKIPFSWTKTNNYFWEKARKLPFSIINQFGKHVSVCLLRQENPIQKMEKHGKVKKSPYTIFVCFLKRD